MITPLFSFLDVKDIRCVVNFDFPHTLEDYVHRIGRTGRAGAAGIAYSFFVAENYKFAKDLIQLLKDSNQEIPRRLYECAEIARTARSANRKGGFRGGGGRGSSSNSMPLGQRR